MTIVDVGLAVCACVASGAATGVAVFRNSTISVCTWVAMAGVYTLAARSSKSGYTVTYEVTATVNTCTAVMACIAVAMVCRLAVGSPKSTCAVTGVVPDIINTRTAVLTAPVVTVVHRLTVLTCVSRLTLTGIAVDAIETRPSVVTGMRGAVIDVGLAVRSGKPSGALTTIARCARPLTRCPVLARRGVATWVGGRHHSRHGRCCGDSGHFGHRGSRRSAGSSSGCDVSSRGCGGGSRWCGGGSRWCGGGSRGCGRGSRGGRAVGRGSARDRHHQQHSAEKKAAARCEETHGLIQLSTECFERRQRHLSHE